MLTVEINVEVGPKTEKRIISLPAYRKYGELYMRVDTPEGHYMSVDNYDHATGIEYSTFGGLNLLEKISHEEITKGEFDSVFKRVINKLITIQQ